MFAGSVGEALAASQMSSDIRGHAERRSLAYAGSVGKASAVSSPLTPKRHLGSRPSVGVEQANLQSCADSAGTEDTFSRGALCMGSSSHRSALTAQGACT